MLTIILKHNKTMFTSFIPAKLPCHKYHSWLVSCSFLLSRELLHNIICLSSSMKLALVWLHTQLKSVRNSKQINLNRIKVWNVINKTAYYVHSSSSVSTMDRSATTYHKMKKKTEITFVEVFTKKINTNHWKDKLRHSRGLRSCFTSFFFFFSFG